MGDGMGVPTIARAGGGGYAVGVAKKVPNAERPEPVPAESLSYEQAMAEVEAIADRIESGEAGLEESVASYERGMALIRHCRAMLERAEQRVVELSADAAAGLGGAAGAANRDAGDEHEEDDDA